MVLPGGIKKKKNQSKGKHHGWPEAQPNKHHQSTAYLVWRCQALEGFLQEGFSPESTASNSAGDSNQFLQEPENCQENTSIVSHISRSRLWGVHSLNFKSSPKSSFKPPLGWAGRDQDTTLP